HLNLHSFPTRRSSDLKQTTSSFKFPRPSARHRSQGIALIIVLSMLVIISGLLVAFMSTALNERGVSQMNADNTAARQLADSTLRSEEHTSELQSLRHL